MSGSETLCFSYGADGAPLGFTYNGTPYYYVTNLQGDVVAITDATGTIVVKYTYDAWGKLLMTSGTLASTIGKVNPLRYRGYYYDNETELYYLQSRYYDPCMGRFISPDSLLVAGDYLTGLNRYAYCNCNPVMYSDPTGRDSEGMAKAMTALVLLCALYDLRFPLLEDLWIYCYIDTGNDATVLLDACIGVFNGIEWIATKFKYGNTPFDITGATIRTGNIADAIATAISSNGVAVILKYFSDEKIGSLFAEYETLFYKIYDEIRLQSLINSGKTLLGIIEVMGGDYLFGVPELFFSATDLFDSYFELETWKEIFSLKEKR